MPLHINLEFVRTEQLSDPYGFSMGLQRYQLRWGRATQRELSLDWDDALLQDLHALSGGSATPQVLLRVGDRLRDTLDHAGWSEQEARIAAALGKGDEVYVHLISGAAELYALPWELLRLRSTGEHLFELQGLHLRYEWPTGFLNAPAGLRAALDTGSRAPHVMLAWSESGGAVPHEAQAEALRKAWPEDALTLLPEATPRSLRSALQQSMHRDKPVEILQLLAHGATRDGQPGLMLGEGRHVPPKLLVNAIGAYAGSLPLVVLSACRSSDAAVASRTDSLALALHRGSVKHGGFAGVIASRNPLSAAGSVMLTQALHGGLAGGRSVDDAFAEARDELQLNGLSLDAASLQLYAPQDSAGGEAPDAGEDTSDFGVRILELQRQPQTGPLLQVGELLEAVRAAAAVWQPKRLEEAKRDGIIVLLWIPLGAFVVGAVVAIRTHQDAGMVAPVMVYSLVGSLSYLLVSQFVLHPWLAQLYTSTPPIGPSTLTAFVAKTLLRTGLVVTHALLWLGAFAGSLYLMSGEM